MDGQEETHQIARTEYKEIVGETVELGSIAGENDHEIYLYQRCQCSWKPHLRGRGLGVHLRNNRSILHSDCIADATCTTGEQFIDCEYKCLKKILSYDLGQSSVDQKLLSWRKLWAWHHLAAEALMTLYLLAVHGDQSVEDSAYFHHHFLHRNWSHLHPQNSQTHCGLTLYPAFAASAWESQHLCLPQTPHPSQKPTIGKSVMVL